jgi:aldehyde dehydrogenase (NAD+)
MPSSTLFGGYRQSGYGREGGRSGLDEFLQVKNVFVGMPGAAALSRRA